MDVERIRGVRDLWAETTGVGSIRVAVLDGSVATDHCCFQGASLEVPDSFPGVSQEPGAMRTHGTMVASILFGQHGSPVQGLAPGCTGVILPVFRDGHRIPQIDVARALDFAITSGAHVVNFSGGQLVEEAEAEGWLESAMERCRKENVLLVAAAGNDGCACLHLPAGLPAALAVGALGDDGKPLEFSNFSDEYASHGILAPGENILGADPEGGTLRASGTSFAAPIVSGVAALLLGMQVQGGRDPDPGTVKKILLDTATPCEPSRGDECPRFLTGQLDIQGAIQAMKEHLAAPESNPIPNSADGSVAATAGSPPGLSESGVHQGPPAVEMPCGCGGGTGPLPAPPQAVAASASAPSSPSPAPQQSGAQPSEVSGGDAEKIAYALGTLGYDFGTEARRDSFKQLMPAVKAGNVLIPANPHDARQMVDYLAANPSEGRALIWTLNMELTPIYALEPAGAFAPAVYGELQALLQGEVEAEGERGFIERVSIPGRLTGRTVRLFSGQVVPVLEVGNVRGLYGWRVNDLVAAAVEAVQKHGGNGADESVIRRSLEGFLNRVYYDLRNLGVTSHDRALNFAVTNAFQAAATFAEAVGDAMELDAVDVERSPFCRQDSDCWDVKLKFFDPENTRRARRIFRFTVDVSDTVPVTLGEVRTWSASQ